MPPPRLSESADHLEVLLNAYMSKYGTRKIQVIIGDETREVSFAEMRIVSLIGKVVENNLFVGSRIVTPDQALLILSAYVFLMRFLRLQVDDFDENPLSSFEGTTIAEGKLDGDGQIWGAKVCMKKGGILEYVGGSGKSSVIFVMKSVPLQI
jgi:hypothetical protein